MIKIDILEYKDNKYYYTLFDILLKNLPITKDSFFKSLDINPSTYRKCRKGELKIGKQILNKLANYYEYKIPSNDLIDELNQNLNRIYDYMYYKIDKTFNDDLNYLDNLIKENYLIFPIIKLFKLLILVSQNLDYNIIKNEYAKLYKECTGYKKFYNESLLYVYNLISYIFFEEIPSDILTKEYVDGALYYGISSRCLIEEKYIECLYFTDKAEEYLYKDGNINRLLLLNNNKMISHLNMSNYKECIILAERQFLILKSIDTPNKNVLQKQTERNFTCALLGLKEYRQVIEYYNTEVNFYLTDFLTLLIAKYYDNVNDYKMYFNDIKSEQENDVLNLFDCMDLLDEYLNTRNKKLISNFKNYDVSELLIKIIKKI